MVNVIRAEGLSKEKLALVVFLQGGVNRVKKEIFIDIENYMDFLQEEYVVRSWKEVLDEYVSLFRGIVVYDYDETDISVNLAATICAAENVLGVPRSLLGEVRKTGLSVLYDVAEFQGDFTERQSAVWRMFRDKLKKDCLVHQIPSERDFHIQLRDFAIAHGAFTFFVRPEEDQEFLAEVLSWADKNIPVYGWTTDELAFVKAISLYGDYLIPSDWSHNHSYFYRKTPQKFIQKVKDEKIKVDPSRHYLAIVVSDGDNVQWLERSFMGESNYGQRLKSARNYKMSWTIAPMLTKLCPEAMKRIYCAADADTFICGVSGVGYTNCMTYPESELPVFARQTSQMMKNADLKILALLDNIQYVNEDTVENRLLNFAKYDNIKGGIWQLDPDRYESGKGRIFWAAGKPFVSVGVSFWHPSNDPAQVTREWIDSIAEEINNKPADPFSEAGYTVLNVHPWTTNMADLDYLVSRLSEKVCIVTAGELIGLVAGNVKYKRESMITINDVARRCGVVKSTVSNALTGKKYVSPDLKKKIIDVCKEMDFQPNFYASTLARGNTNILALVLEEDSDKNFRGFYSDLIMSCLKAAARAGKHLLIYTGLDKKSVGAMLKRSKAPIDGAIIMTPLVDDMRIVQMEKQRIPCVIIGRPDDSVKISYVDVNNVQLVSDVVDRLASSGYRKFCLVNSEENKTISIDRLKGMESSLAKLEGAEKCVVYTSCSSEEEGYRSAIGKMEKGMAFITSDGTIARGVFKAAEAVGLDPLKDIKIYSLGEDEYRFDIPWEYARQDYKKLGEIAMKILLGEIEGDSEPKQICSNCYVV